MVGEPRAGGTNGHLYYTWKLGSNVNGSNRAQGNIVKKIQHTRL